MLRSVHGNSIPRTSADGKHFQWVWQCGTIRLLRRQTQPSHASSSSSPSTSSSKPLLTLFLSPEHHHCCEKKSYATVSQTVWIFTKACARTLFLSPCFPPSTFTIYFRIAFETFLFPFAALILRNKWALCVLHSFACLHWHWTCAGFDRLSIITVTKIGSTLNLDSLRAVFEILGASDGGARVVWCLKAALVMPLRSLCRAKFARIKLNWLIFWQRTSRASVLVFLAVSGRFSSMIIIGSGTLTIKLPLPGHPQNWQGNLRFHV